MRQVPAHQRDKVIAISHAHLVVVGSFGGAVRQPAGEGVPESLRARNDGPDSQGSSRVGRSKGANPPKAGMGLCDRPCSLLVRQLDRGPQGGVDVETEWEECHIRRRRRHTLEVRFSRPSVDSIVECSTTIRHQETHFWKMGMVGRNRRHSDAVADPCFLPRSKLQYLLEAELADLLARSGLRQPMSRAGLSSVSPKWRGTTTTALRLRSLRDGMLKWSGCACERMMTSTSTSRSSGVLSGGS